MVVTIEQLVGLQQQQQHDSMQWRYAADVLIGVLP